MAIRQAKAVWQGNLKDGRGTMEIGSGSFRGSYSFRSRFETGAGTNPEELIAGAHAGCFSMALAHGLASAGYTPQQVATTAKVHLTAVSDGFAISLIELATEAAVPGIAPELFQTIARDAKVNCPVSRALAGIRTELTATLV